MIYNIYNVTASVVTHYTTFYSLHYLHRQQIMTSVNVSIYKAYVMVCNNNK